MVTRALVWSAESTTATEIAAALRGLLRACHEQATGCVPARVLNLICVADRGAAGAVSERLAHTGRVHASRTILCALDPDRAAVGAAVALGPALQRARGDFAVLQELLRLELGDRHVRHLDTIVDPLLVSDLTTMLWCHGGHQDAQQVLLPLIDVVLLDSAARPDAGAALADARELLRSAYVVDLAWLRSTPWRERVAAAFDPPAARSEVAAIEAVSVRHHPGSASAGLLLLGWLASRLDWRVSALTGDDGRLIGTTDSAAGRVRLALEPDAQQSVPGLSGLTLALRSGRRLALDRAPVGLRACEREPGGRERRWTVFGASRGEPGILGDGIRQALLRDPAYAPALVAATALAGSPAAAAHAPVAR
jgi:glucose-6-phosphate dehydrogenase assembly protein OpcA